MYLFICAFFNHGVSTSDSTVMNCRKINEQCTDKNMEGRGLWIIKVLYFNCLKRPRKISKLSSVVGVLAQI